MYTLGLAFRKTNFLSNLAGCLVHQAILANPAVINIEIHLKVSILSQHAGHEKRSDLQVKIFCISSHSLHQQYFFVAQVAHVELPSQEKLGQELLCFAVDNHAQGHTSHHSKDHQHAMISMQ